jgi:hypothetical protein
MFSSKFRARAPVARGAVLGIVMLVSCGGSSAPPSQTAPPTARPEAAAAAESRPSGPSPAWNRLVEEQLAWSRPDLRNYCMGETVPVFLPRAPSADHPDAVAARDSGCKMLSATPEGSTVCCSASLPVAPNPNTGGGKSCEEALFDYDPSDEEEEMKSPSADKFGAVLNRGSYFAHCKVPSSTKLDICAAIQNGSAVGVTIRTQPHDPKLADCVAKSVLGLRFPSRPKLDITKTSFQ